MSGANTYSGGTTVSGGKLLVANATALSNSGGVTVNAGGIFEIATDKTVGALSGAGTINLNGNRLTTSSAQTVAFSGVANGSGGITKAGTGTLTLSGTNLYTGDTTVTAGTLSLTGSVAGTASVASGGTLGGTGAVTGVLTVADGTVAPGVGGVGTLTVGGLVLGSNSTLSYDLGAPGVLAASDHIQVNGNLTLDGTLNASDAGGFGQGVYSLITYTGSLTDNGLVVGTLPSGFTPGQTQVQTSVGGQVNLVVSGALPDIQFWDGTNTAANNSVDGGAGSWNTSSFNWTDAAGDANTPWGGKFAVFQGTPGTVTVDGTIDFTGLQFMSGYTIAAGTGTFVATDPSSTIRVDPGVTATISASIGGTGGIQKLDTGTLVLAGANTYAGATVVNGGTLRASTTGALPGTSAVTVASGATLDIAASQTIGSLTGAGSVTLSGGGLTTGGAGTSTQFSGIISGAGGLTKAGTGTFTLSGINTYGGGTTVSGGTLQLASGGTLGSGALTVSTGATMDLNGVATTVGTLSGAGAITLGSATLTAGGSTDSSFTGIISGNGGFTKMGTSNLTLSGNNTYAGTTEVAGGTLTLGTATAIPTTAAVTVDSGATLALGAAKTIGSLAGSGTVSLGTRTLTVASGSFAGALTGTGGLTKSGSTTLTLTGASSYTGLTTVSGGTLSLGQGASIATSSGVTLSASGATLDVASAQTIGTLSGVTGSAVTLEGALTETNSGTASFAGTLSGAGGFTKAGTGTLTLSAADTNSGGTTASAGTLRAGTAGAFGSGLLTAASGATVDLAGFAQSVSGLSGSGTITLGSGTLSAGDATNSSFGGLISGTGALTKTGTGTLTLAGTNTYSGATTINAGTLSVNGSIASPVTIGLNGALGGNGTVGAVTVQGTLSPGNSIGLLNVSGNLTFAAGSTYLVQVNAAGQGDATSVLGAVTINGGTVKVHAAQGTYQPQTNYPILLSSGGVTGTFSGVTSDTAFLTPSLLYSGNSVTLRMTRNDVSFASVGVTPNQISVGAALATVQSGTLYNAVVGLSADGARNAYDGLSGEVHADALTLANREAQTGQRPLLDRLAAPDTQGSKLWIQGTDSHSSIDASDGYAGVSANRYGVLMGAEFSGAGARLGVAAGYGSTDGDVSARASNINISTASITAYAGWHDGDFHVNGGAGYLSHKVKTDRTVAFGGLTDTPSAQYSGNTLLAFGEAGYTITLPTVAIEPFAGVSYARTRMGSATESGGAAALSLAGDGVNTTLATAGLRGSVMLSGQVRIDATLAARDYLSGDRATRHMTLTSVDQDFTVLGADVGRTGGLARVGISLPMLGGTISASAEGDFARGANDYGGWLSAGWRF